MTLLIYNSLAPMSLGLFSYSQVDLEVLMKAGLPQEKKNAARILPIVKNEYLLLCTLLIAKSLALETLPVFLDTILPFWAAILVSVTFVMAFAEVIPQAVCSRYGLSLSAKSVPFVRFLLLILFPVSYPVSKLLYWLLGKGHSELLRRAQLKTLVDLHSIKAGKGGDLTDDETTIIAGALDMTEKTAKDAMTPISETFSLDVNSKLDMHTMGLIVSEGHSRVPIYFGNPNNIIALMLVKNLIFCHPDDEIPVQSITLRRMPRVYETWPLYDVLKLFQKGHSHMAVVVKSGKNTKETEEMIKSAPELSSNIHSKLELASAVFKGTNPSFGEKELFNNSPYYSGHETRVTVVENITKLEHPPQPLNMLEQEGGNISSDELESLKTKFVNEEVVGILTMEDVMEELLQEEILDESDLNVLNKNRINFFPWKKSHSSSPGVASVASPLSSYYYNTILRSPIPPYIPSPLVRPTLLASPGKSRLNSPAGSVAPVCSSQSSRQISRKSYERLQQPDPP